MLRTRSTCLKRKSSPYYTEHQWVQLIKGVSPYAETGLYASFLVVDAILEGRLPANTEILKEPIDLGPLLTQCWKWEPSERPTAAEAYEQLAGLAQGYGIEVQQHS